MRLKKISRLTVVVVIGMIVNHACAQQKISTKSGQIPKIADESIYQSMLLSKIKIPPRLYTEEVKKLLAKRKNPLSLVAGTGRADVGKRVTKEIPLERWKELIPPYAAFTMAGVPSNTPCPVCPFCGKDYKQPQQMTVDELISNPFQAKTGCCGAIIYEREEDMPDDYPVKPNHTEMITHLDGKKYPYRFYVPPGLEKSDYGFDSNRSKWFCSASEAWLARASLIHTQPHDSVLKGLASQALRFNDEKAYRTLAVIYDRLAEVYPGWPLVDYLHVANGIARSKDMKGYLTKEEYKATSVPREFEKPDWFKGRYYNLAKFPKAAGWQDGVLAHLANMIDIFDLIHDNPAVLAYSKERYGDEKEWEKKVRKRLVGEAHFLAQCSPTGLRGGNTSIGWMQGALKIGTVMRDEFFIRNAAIMVERAVQNQFFGDGMSVEGAFNYGGMMQGTIDLIPVLRDYFGIDYSNTFPYTKVVSRLGPMPVRTLLNIESMHNDEHANFFTGCGNGWKIPPYKNPAYGNEAAQCFPEYGLIALRAGAPGSRMEVIFNFLTALGHGHQANLNLQLFYEGVQAMPDIGYGCVSADIRKAPWSDIKYPFKKLPFPPGVDFWWAWYGHYSVITETHNVAMVDGEHTKYPRYGPVTFRRFLGMDSLDRPGSVAQFAEADADGMFSLRPKETKVDMFNRQIAAVTLPSGRSLLLDFHRLRGGRRHDLIWHAPSTGPEAVLKTSLGPSTPIPNLTLYDYFLKEIPGYDNKLTEGKGIRNFKRLGRWHEPKEAWEVKFEIRPKLFEPATPGGKKIYEPWSKALKDVNLNLWGSMAGSPVTKSELLEARAPWPSKIREVVDGKEYGVETICLEDAFHFFFEARIAEKNGLYSAYAHVLEPRLPDQTSVVQSIQQLVPAKGDDKTASGLRVEMKPEDQDSTDILYAGTSINGGKLASKNFSLEGRFGLVIPKANTLCLYDGKSVAAEGLRGTVEPSLNLELLGVIGDITGTPQESALIVESDQPLPVDKTLVGRMLTVQHKISPIHTSGYTISKISPWGENKYRIDLAHNPPFIIHRMSVKTIDPSNPQKMESDYLFMKGQNLDGIYTGRRIRFPRFSFDSPMKLQTGGWHVFKFEVLDKLPEKADIKIGEPFIVYQIQPGDNVIIPSHLAVKSSPIGYGFRLDVESTGPVTLEVPGRYKSVLLSRGPEQVSLETAKQKGGGMHIELKKEDLPDGRAALMLLTQ